MKKIIFLIIILAIGYGAYKIYNVSHKPNNQNESQHQNKITETPSTSTSINGLSVATDIANRRPIAIMVENHPDSRPQSGLDKADIIYETVAEGGITRFLAVYQTAEETNIGPIRSARPYYLNLASQYNPIFVHVGGSDEALADLKDKTYSGIDDLNEFYNGNYFKRITTRSAPHNAYSKIQTIRKYLEDKKLKQTSSNKTAFNSFLTKNESVNGTPATTINLNFSLPDFLVSYRYNPENNNYVRILAGKAHTQAETQKALTADTILVQAVTITAIPNDPKLRVKLDLSSGGKLYAFMEGKLVKGTWDKNSSGSTEYKDESGNPLKIQPGKIWVELISNDDPARITWSTPDQPKAQK